MALLCSQPASLAKCCHGPRPLKVTWPLRIARPRRPIDVFVRSGSPQQEEGQRIPGTGNEDLGLDKSGSLSEIPGLSEAETGTFIITDWATFVLVLFQLGATLGTFTDGLHSQASLQLYNVGAIQLGNLRTSLAVPPLLGVFYVVLGLLVPLTDNLFQSDPSTQKAQKRATDVLFVALGFAVLAGLTYLSAVLYEHGTPYNQISLTLGAGALANWYFLDRTKQGLILSTICAVGAPAAELVLLHFVPLWSYPRADILNESFVSWVPWCYFFCVPALQNLARFLYSICQADPSKQS